MTPAPQRPFSCNQGLHASAASAVVNSAAGSINSSMAALIAGADLQRRKSQQGQQSQQCSGSSGEAKRADALPPVRPGVATEQQQMESAAIVHAASASSGIRAAVQV